LLQWYYFHYFALDELDMLCLLWIALLT